GQRAQIEKVLPHTKSGTAAPGGVDKQGRQAGEMFGAGLDGIDPAPFALVEAGGGQQIADRENAGERGADLVGERRERRLDDAGYGSRSGGLARLAGGNAFFRRPALRRPRGALGARFWRHDSPEPGPSHHATAGLPESRRRAVTPDDRPVAN